MFVYQHFEYSNFHAFDTNISVYFCVLYIMLCCIPEKINTSLRWTECAVDLPKMG